MLVIILALKNCFFGAEGLLPAPAINLVSADYARADEYPGLATDDQVESILSRDVNSDRLALRQNLRLRRCRARASSARNLQLSEPCEREVLLSAFFA